MDEMQMRGWQAGIEESRNRQHRQRMDEMRFAQVFNRQQSLLRACMARAGFVWMN